MGRRLVINGGCSNDGFDYFRGWLIVQDREVFEHVVADPDALADLPVVRACAPGEARLECEDTLYIPARAHRAAAGQELPPHSSPIPYWELDPAWDFDFDDRTEMKRRLPPAGCTLLTDVTCCRTSDQEIEPGLSAWELDRL